MIGAAQKAQAGDRRLPIAVRKAQVQLQLMRATIRLREDVVEAVLAMAGDWCRRAGLNRGPTDYE